MTDPATVEKVARAIFRNRARYQKWTPEEAKRAEDKFWNADPEDEISDALAALAAHEAAIKDAGMMIGPATISEPVAAWEAKAAEFHAANVAEARGDPEYKRGDLKESARLLRRWLADAAPANEHGQVSFLRALVEAHLVAVDEVIEDQDRAMIAASDPLPAPPESEPK